jgi:hypothetical protein
VIRIQSAGRLGSQLFIWAFAKYIKELHHERVVIFNDSFHAGELSELQEFMQATIQANQIYLKQMNTLGLISKTADKLSSMDVKLRQAFGYFFRIQQQVNPYLYFEPIATSGAIIRGFFQNPTYAEAVHSSVIADLNQYTLRILDEKRSNLNSVLLRNDYQVLHIRRGDYIGSSFGVLDLQYLNGQLREDLPLIVTTDSDISQIDLPTFIKPEEIFTPQTASGWEAISIIAGAKRVYSSNSTLSWWGSYIALNRGAEVFLPEPWHKSISVSEFHFETSRMKVIPAQFI